MKKVDISNARTKDYADVLKRIQKDNVCPFCEAHFLKYHTKPILKKGRYWTLTENFKPYAGAKHHLLLVARKHVEHFADLSSAAQRELFSLFEAEVTRRGIKGGTLLMRFGAMDYTGGSVSHLHAQIVTGSKRGKNTEPLLTAIGCKKKA